MDKSSEKIRDKIQKKITDNIQKRAKEAGEKINDKGKAYVPFKDANVSPAVLRAKYKQQLGITKKETDKNLSEKEKKTFQKIKAMSADELKNKLDERGFDIAVNGKTFSYGNTKLPPSTLIVNLTSAFSCPSLQCPLRTICYGLNVEDYSPQCQMRNLRNYYAFKYIGIKELMWMLKVYIERAPVRIKNIRISEEGDFDNQEQIDLADKLAGHLKAKYGINTACYTHRVDLNFSNCKNMIVNMSSPQSQDGTRHYFPISKAGYERLKEGEIIDDGTRQRPYYKCPGDCTRCNFCYQTKEQNGEPDNIMVDVICKAHSK